MINDALIDKDFLLKLDQWRHKTLFVKIISLNFDEDPITEITGNITGGNINVDGSSSVRRTCNLTLITEATRIDELDWALRTKFKVFIGLENTIEPKYDNIIWFPQGIFVISSFSATLNNQGYTINIQGKDKMCLLNGDIGGQLFAAHEFSTIYTTHKDGTITKDKIPIYNIIKEAIHTYAQEPYKNIIINDLDSCGVELIDYKCNDSKMYIFEQRRNDDDPWVSQICFSGSFMADEFENEYENTNEQSWDLYKDLDGIHYHLLKRIDPETDIDTTAGYRATDLTYPDDLMVEVGGNITSMLDSIIKLLGEFEYFYDIDGRFIFQRKKIYFNSAWNNGITIDDETYYDSIANNSAVAYDFYSSYLVESYQNKPNLNTIRNDYSVWGKRKNASGSELTLHMRYAIDQRPSTYWSLLEKRLYVSNAYRYEIIEGYQKTEDGQIIYDSDGNPKLKTSSAAGPYDWRELIYQMARDNLKATSMIQALTAALSLNGDNKLYHGSYYKMARKGQEDQDYRNFYKYNDLTKKFEKLKKLEIAEDADETAEQEYQDQAPYYGQTEFEYCQQNKIPLFTPDATLAEWTLTEQDIININRDLRYGHYYDNEDHMYEDPEAAYPDYSYDTNSFNTKYYNIIYSNMTTAEKEEALNELLVLQEREQNIIAHYTKNNIAEDMRRELDEWSDTFKTGYDAYYADMLQFWPQLYRSSNIIEYMYDEDGKLQIDEITGNPKYSKNSLSPADWKKWCDNGYWNPDLITYNNENQDIQFKNPEMLLFWLDFIEQDQDPALWQYAVSLIGRRSKSINDDKVKAIYFRDTPLILFTSEDYVPVPGEEKLNYVRINLGPPLSNYFSISSQGKSAKSVMDGLIYEGTYYQDSITITCVPIYYLSPNTRISVQDNDTGINGQYLIKSFSIQLTHNGTMSITATKVAETII